MSLKRSVAIVLLAGCATAAFGQLRTIPEDAERGEIRHVQGMTVTVDGAERQLSPGAQIRSEANLIMVPAAIPAGAVARYLVDPNGMIHRVWILTPEEAARSERR